MYILASFWGALGFIFKQLRRPFRSSRALRQTIEKHSSKSLVKRSCAGLAGVWGQQTQPRRGSSRFLRPRLLSLRIQLPSQACFSHVGPQKPRVFTWFRDFHAFLCPPVAPRGQRSHENAVRNHLSKGPSRQLRDRSAQGPWLGGRVLGAHAPLEIRPPSL